MPRAKKVLAIDFTHKFSSVLIFKLILPCWRFLDPVGESEGSSVKNDSNKAGGHIGNRSLFKSKIILKNMLSSCMLNQTWISWSIAQIHLAPIYNSGKFLNKKESGIAFCTYNSKELNVYCANILHFLISRNVFETWRKLFNDAPNHVRLVWGGQNGKVARSTQSGGLSMSW